MSSLTCTALGKTRTKTIGPRRSLLGLPTRIMLTLRCAKASSSCCQSPESRTSGSQLHARLLLRSLKFRRVLSKSSRACRVSTRKTQHTLALTIRFLSDSRF